MDLRIGVGRGFVQLSVPTGRMLLMVHFADCLLSVCFMRESADGR
jgi:hypothetical protein